MDSLKKVIDNVYKLESELKIKDSFNMMQFYNDVYKLESEHKQYKKSIKKDIVLRIV